MGDDQLYEDIRRKYNIRKEQAKGVFLSLQKQHQKISDDHEFLKKQLETEHGSKNPILNVPATREECKAAVIQVETNDSEFWVEMAPRMEQMVQKWDNLHKSSREYMEHYDDIYDRGQIKYLGQVDLNRAYLTDGGVQAYMLQKAVLGLVKYQDVELRRWFYQLMSFGDHLNRKNVEIKKVVEKGGCFMSRDIPSEIAQMIFSHCGLETCVALRQVSSFWYALFQHSEDHLKQLLLKRNPWMKPEGSLKSWADCAVVFVSRISSEKWTKRRGKSDRQLDPVKRLVASEIEYGEKLDPDFVTLEDHHDVSRNLCDRVMVEDVVHGTKYMNPWTHETNVVSSILEVVYESDGVVVRKNGVELTLPPNSKTPSEVNIDEQFVSVMTYDPNRYFFVFDRNKPLHYKYAYSLDVPEANDYGGVGGVFRLRFIHPFLNGFYDFTRDKPRRVIYDMPEAWPVAVYQGIIWWRPDSGGELIPTFMDVKSRKIRYRPEWDLLIDSNWMSLNQVAKEGNTQYVCTSCHKGFRMIDLETRSLTRVDPSEEHNGPMIAGFVDGKFQVKVYDPETISTYAEVNS